MPRGLAEVEAAKADCRWDAAYPSQRDATVRPISPPLWTPTSRRRGRSRPFNRFERYAVIVKLVTTRTNVARTAASRTAITALRARQREPRE